jgi:outer membrane protein assembly factor BamB
MANTRDVASAITSSNVSKLGVAWTVPLTISTAHTDGAYATTPVIVNGVVYVQDLDSDVFAISLATGKVLWTHDYNSPNGGPDGVNVAGGVVYAATNRAAVALNAATGAQLWSRTLIGNDHEGIDGDLYALDAATGAILFKTAMSAGSNAPVAVDGDYVIAGAGVALSSTQRDMIIAYKLGATGKLPDTVGS